MNLYQMLQARAEAGRPVRVGIVGAGKFGTMFLAQARRTPGMHIVGIADLAVSAVRDRLQKVGWDAGRLTAPSLQAAYESGATHITDDADALIEFAGLEVLIEATGNPAVGIRHCLAAFNQGLSVIMVNVEADVVAGPLLARKAQQAGVVYSLAYGDQPALICEQVDWARAAGFDVVTAGKGTRYLPHFHQSTPDTIWANYHLSPEQAERGGLNPKMFNSFVDGTKSGIEMSAVCNATGLTPQPGGLAFPAVSTEEIADKLKPAADGGLVSHKGTTEVISSLHRDGSDVAPDLQMGVYVVVEADTDYVRHCFEEYRMLPDASYRYAALYRPTHMIGLELGISVASVALRGEPTGCPTGFRSDVVASAKKDLAAGTLLDGEGGYCVWGKQVPAARSLEIGGLPLGLAHDVTLKTGKNAGELLTWADVAIDESLEAVRIRREMEAAFGRPNQDNNPNQEAVA